MFQLGVMGPGLSSDIIQGYIWGNWPSGEETSNLWIGFPVERTATYAWSGVPPFIDKYNRNVWKHQCFAVDFSTGMFTYFLDGIKIFSVKNIFKDVKAAMDAFPTQFNFVSLGCSYQSAGSKMKSIVGQVTDLQIFNSVLEESEMKAYTNCEKMLKGDLLTWDKIPWILAGSKQVSEIEYLDIQNDICAQQDSSLILLPFPLQKEPHALEMCGRLSSNIASYTNETDLDEILHFLAKRNNLHENECISQTSETEFLMTAGIDGKLVDGYFINPSTSSEISYLPWDDGRPWGGVHQCLFLSVNIQLINTSSPVIKSVAVQDESCNDFEGGCFICKHDKPAIKFSIRGLCSGSKLDRTYMLRTQDDGNPVYVGRHTSFLYFDAFLDLWIWMDRKDNKSIALCNKKMETLILGKNTCDFSNFHDKCGEASASVDVEIKLTSCSAGLFTCEDGQCIDMEHRCDQNPNCVDQSDEVNCQMLVKSDTYKKTIAPFSYNGTNGQVAPVLVNVSMDIISLLKFKEVDMEFVLKYQIKKEWFDTRLTYWNLKERRYANALSSEEKESIWLPILTFTNTENNEVTAGDIDSEVTVTRASEFIRSEANILDEINIFNGGENKLTYERVYTKIFRCDYQLQLYPFDTQRCFVDISTKKLDKYGVIIHPYEIEMSGATVLTQYIVTYWSFDYANNTDHSAGLRVTLVLKRRIMNELLTSYLPTILILIIVYATNYFKDFFFEAVVSVNLTSLLVLTTLFISVSGSLPKTSYVKLIDVWLIFAQLIPFAEVLLHTYMDSLRGEEEGQEREVNHHGKTITVGGANSVTPSAGKEMSFFMKGLLLINIISTSNVFNGQENPTAKIPSLYPGGSEVMGWPWPVVS